MSTSLTDSAGKVWLDGLEAGEHKLTVRGEKYKFSKIPAAAEWRIPVEAIAVFDLKRIGVESWNNHSH